MMKKLKKNAWILVAFGMVLAFGLSLPVNSWAKEKVIIWASPLMGQMDPATQNDQESIESFAPLYNNLVMVDRDGKIIPDLAESWKISPDYKDFTFYLRKGVKFHDGTPFNAQAVKFTYDRIVRVNRAGTGNYRDYADLNSCEVIDDYTIKIHLKKPYPIFILDQMNSGYHIVGPAYVQKHATADDPDALKWMSDHACGTGPFKLAEFVPGERIVYEKFDEYWGGSEGGKSTPIVDKIIQKVVKDPSTAMMMLERGDVDIAERLTYEQFDKLRATPGTKVSKFVMPKLVYMAFDVSEPPFNDINVRKAISHAINYDEMIKYIEKSNARRAPGFIPEGVLGHDSTIPFYTFDLDKAIEYMKNSAYPKGFTTNLMYAIERKAEFEQAAEYIQSYLKKIGINVKPQKIAFDVQLAMQEKGNYGLSLMTYSALMPSADDTAGWVYDTTRAHGGWNASHWYDKDVVAKLVKAREIDDLAEQEALYKAVDRKAVENAVYIYLYRIAIQFAMRENVKNFFFDSYTFHYWWLVDK
jgi:peptide/nickel transport system substrate-binding protein